MKDGIKLSGKWKFDIVSVESKKVIKVIEFPNLITTVGKAAVAKVLSEEVLTALFQYIAFGGGNTAPTVGDTILETELARVVPTSIVRAGNVITVVGIAGSSVMNGLVVQEVGVFGIDATGSADTGDLLSRTTSFTPINKNGTIEIHATYELTIN
jgi:hypothetical protein